MLSSLKKRLYFVVAAYFGFWAKFVMKRWRPRVIVVTGSSGKTTLFYMLEAQLGEQAFYSHHANSAHGLAFLILGYEPNVGSRLRWLTRGLTAPVHVFRHPPRQNIFVAEADADRPKEADFLSKLLKPEVTLWVSVYRTHSMNFDAVVRSGRFASHEEAIAYEFGWFPARTGKLVVANADQSIMHEQLKRVPQGVRVVEVGTATVKDYGFDATETTYEIGKDVMRMPGLHPKELGTSLQMVQTLLEYLDLPLDTKYAKLHMPPGRSSVFKGRKDITIVDSTYNTGLGAMKAILRLFQDYPAEHKWVVLGDILEQGSLESEEHQGLARAVAELKPEHVVLLGPRTAKDTAPLVRELLPKTPLASFDSPKEVLDYLEANLKGGEAVLFKGGRFLEGVIEQLLADPADADKLVRREKVWIKRRQSWGLPQ